MASGDDSNKWHSQPATVGVVSATVAAVMAFLAVWKVLVAPLENNIADMKITQAALQVSFDKWAQIDAARWAALPNVTSLQGQVTSLMAQEKLQDRTTIAHDAKHGHVGIIADMATATQRITTEEAERRAVDAFSVSQRAEAIKRLDTMEAEVGMLRERIARVEVSHARLSVQTGEGH